MEYKLFAYMKDYYRGRMLAQVFNSEDEVFHDFELLRKKFKLVDGLQIHYPHENLIEIFDVSKGAYIGFIESPYVNYKKVSGGI